MTPLDLAAIEKAAKEATQGEWGSEATAEGAFTVLDMDGAVLCSRAPWPHRAAESCANAAFIALANPATILALCERIREPAKVKPLEWTDYRKFPDEPWSETMLRSRIGHHNLGRYAGSYSVFETAQGGPWGWKCSWISDREPEAIFPTEAEAIDAAQADYASRIRSALITETDNG